MNYLDVQSQAHELMLAEILKGKRFDKMMKSPLQYKDLQWGVPQMYNLILDNLLINKCADSGRRDRKKVVYSDTSSEGSNNESRHHDFCGDEKSRDKGKSHADSDDEDDRPLNSGNELLQRDLTD